MHTSSFLCGFWYEPQVLMCTQQALHWLSYLPNTHIENLFRGHLVEGNQIVPQTKTTKKQTNSKIIVKKLALNNKDHHLRQLTDTTATIWLTVLNWFCLIRLFDFSFVRLCEVSYQTTWEPELLWRKKQKETKVEKPTKTR